MGEVLLFQLAVRGHLCTVLLVVNGSVAMLLHNICCSVPFCDWAYNLQVTFEGDSIKLVRNTVLVPSKNCKLEGFLHFFASAE